MPRLLQGRIVYCRKSIPDPQGRNAKENRPFVVITSDDRIKAGASFLLLVAITSQIDPNRNDVQVPLPYGPNARTGLRVESVAQCQWVVQIAVEDVEVGVGIVPPSCLVEIIKKVKELHNLP